MAAKKVRPSKSGDCVLPTRPKPEFLRASLVESSPREESDIAGYFEWQSSKDPKGPAFVEHLELVKSETVFGREYKVWDVHATDGRWWVVTNPTNLYSQEHIPSLDYVLSLHVGLMARVVSRDSRRAQAPNIERFAAAWRRWEQAAEAVDSAAEAEDFQSIGMKCRECLLAFVRDAQVGIAIPADTEEAEACRLCSLGRISRRLGRVRIPFQRCSLLPQAAWRLDVATGELAYPHKQRRATRC